jgi:hypothetical protein
MGKPGAVRDLRFRVAPPHYLPGSDLAETFDCEKRVNECSVSLSEGSVDVALNFDLDRTTVATLTAEFATLEPVDQGEGVQSYTVSWVIRESA